MFSRVGLVIGRDPEGVTKVQMKVNGRLVYNRYYTNSFLYLRVGSEKKGKVILEARAMDRFGRWGPYAKRVILAE
jgi:hypothetical protein